MHSYRPHERTGLVGLLILLALGLGAVAAWLYTSNANAQTPQGGCTAPKCARNRRSVSARSVALVSPAAGPRVAS
jgi:hypothetical protein